MEIPDWLRILELMATISTPIIIAIVSGGFALYRFRKERTHASRIQLRIDCDSAHKKGSVYLSTTVSAENIGNTRVVIKPRYCTVWVYAHAQYSENLALHEIREVFGNQDWLEPNEVVSEDMLSELALAPLVAVQVDFYMAEEVTKRLRG